jgi:rhamnogalacturonan endolyase
LTVAQAPAAISLGSLQATFDGMPQSVTVSTAPAGLPVSVTYNESQVAPTNAGSYSIVATIDDANYAGTALGTLTIAKRAVSLDLVNLRQPYNGAPRTVTATTTPEGLPVTVTYDGRATPPTNPGAYVVEALVDDANNSGSADATFVITVTALVRHAPSLNGDIDGSMQVLSGESFALNGTALVAGDILLPGTPSVRLNGNPIFVGTIDGDGDVSPSNYQVMLNGNVALRHLVRRSDPIALPTVASPPAPTGTRNVSLNSPGQSAGDFATLRNLTLDGNVGGLAVPAGTYGSFIANGGSGFTLGVAGANTPATYNLQNLVLNGTGRLTIAGPVILNLASGFMINGDVGDSGHPGWLIVNIASGGVMLNGSATFHGQIMAPNGTVTINGNSVLHGTVACDRLTLNGNGLVADPQAEEL